MSSNNYNERPTIRLSKMAWDILDGDHEIFDNAKPKDSFLNTIFLNFYEKAECSFLLRYEEHANICDNLKESLLKERRMQKLDENSIKAFINTYLKSYKETLIPFSTETYADEESRKVRLNAESKLVIDQIFEINEKIKLYTGDFERVYLKALFEEYARLPYAKREQIYFKDWIKDFDTAKDEGRSLKIYQSTSQKSFHVIPYKILQDRANLYNYIVGYAQELENDEPKSGKPAAFRFTNIKKITPLSGRTPLRSSLKADIENKLRKMDVPYLVGQPEFIDVRFDKKGVKMLKSHLYMRPPFERDPLEQTETHTTYRFTCTQTQAMNYFFKFGKFAYIVSPIELREKFKQRYLDDYNAYVANEENKKKED